MRACTILIWFPIPTHAILLKEPKSTDMQPNEPLSPEFADKLRELQADFEKKRRIIEVEQGRKRTLKQITNADHDNSVTALLPLIEEREEVPHVEFVVDDIPPCCHNKSQNIHPMLSRYRDGPASDAYMSYAWLMAIVQYRARTVEFLQGVGVLAKF